MDYSVDDGLGRLAGRSCGAGRPLVRPSNVSQQPKTVTTHKLSDLNELREEVEDDINQIVFEWQDKAQNVTAYDVPLEKTDIAVDDIALVWLRS